ncbi:Ethylene-insensitive protein 2 [Dionaea muscipula]
MEAEDPSSYNNRGFFIEIIPVVAPLFLVAVGYIEPGKWAACIESGARFGGDLTGFLLIFYLVGILYQYLSAHVTVVSGRNLAQICRDEYDRRTSILLGVQAELSMILLDLGMILGIAQGLNMIFGLDLFSSVILTALAASLFSLSAILLEKSKIKFLSIWVTGLTFCCYVIAMMISQPEFSLPPNSALFKLSGETAFALMSLLGANVMPHNFYLHSSIVQRYLGPSGGPNCPRFYNSVFAIVTIFSGVSLVNFLLINSAANVFNSAGLVLLTFQDALSLMDQVSMSSIMLFAFFLLMFMGNQMSSLSWEFGEEGGGHTILHDFFGIDHLSGWLHRAAIRIFAVVAALYCLWHSGAEGMYQMLIFTQVMIALLVPSSAIPLFRIASSRPIMGAYKMSPILEFLALITLLGFVILEVVLVVEMIFGDSDWVGNLRWNMVVNNNVSAPYIFLLVGSCISLCSMLWMFVTPLKSATAWQEFQPRIWDVQKVVAESFAERDRDEETSYYEVGPSSENYSGCSNSVTPVVAKYDVHLPENFLDTIEENSATTSSMINDDRSSSSFEVAAPIPSIVDDGSDIIIQSLSVKNELNDHVEKAVVNLMEDDFKAATHSGDDELGDNTWEHEEEGPSKEEEESVVIGQSVAPEGPGGSLRSLSGKSDESGNGPPGSLSRLSGLGRAARRQLSYALDEFWGQLYDFHGQLTQEAKSRKLDLLLGVASNSKLVPSPTREDSDEYGGSFPSCSRGSDSLVNSGFLSGGGGGHQLQMMRGIVEPSFGTQRRSSPSIWSPSQSHSHSHSHHQMQSSDAVDIGGERRYSSLQFPPSSDGLEHQPATVHGYQLASFVGRIMKDRSDDYMTGSGTQGESVSVSVVSPKPIGLGTANYRDPLASSTRRVKATNGYRSLHEPPPGFENRCVLRNRTMNSDKPPPYYDLFSNESFDYVAAANQSNTNTKKYHSLPDISGLSLPSFRTLYSTTTDAATNSIWATPGSTSGTRIIEQGSLYSRVGSRMGTCTNVSLWSKPPFEQFGVAANKTSSCGVGDEEEVGRKLLQSMRHCILKLLKLEGSDWLFRQNDGADEELIERVAARERFLLEAESRDEQQQTSSSSSSSSSPPDDRHHHRGVSSIPNCGDGCVWKSDLILSFGVWCIHRILELSLVESRPELWGRYTYVLNRLQGVIEMAFFKPRSPTPPCFCLQFPPAYQQRSNPPPVVVASNGIPPPLMRAVRGKLTTEAMLLDIIKDIEVAISCRKGRAGTAAGDVAFPKGKENLASVLKRYKRRLTNKPMVRTTQDGGSGTRKQLPNS